VGYIYTPQRLLEGLELASNEGTLSSLALPQSRDCAQASTPSERSGSSKPLAQIARAHAAAQPDEFRVGNCAAETKGSSELKSSAGADTHPMLSRTAPSNGEVEGPDDTPDERRGRTLSYRARGAKPLTSHGPLQRLLDRSIS